MSGRKETNRKHLIPEYCRVNSVSIFFFCGEEEVLCRVFESHHQPPLLVHCCFLREQQQTENSFC